MTEYFDYKDQTAIGVFYQNIRKVEKEYPNLAKWIIYYVNADTFGVDCDVMQDSLAKLLEHQKIQLEKYGKENIFESAVIEKQNKKDAFDYKYQIDGAKDGKIYRADTLNSFSITFVQFLRLNFKFVPKEEYALNKNTKCWLNYFVKNFEHINTEEHKEILEKFDIFAKLTHTIGNFMIVPASFISEEESTFNILKARKNDVNDYFQFALKDIEEYCRSTKETLLIKDYNAHWIKIYDNDFNTFKNVNSLSMCTEKYNFTGRNRLKMIPKTIEEIELFLGIVIKQISLRNQEINDILSK